MTATVGIVGMGWVGSSVAISLLHRALAARLLVGDVRSEIAEGEAMDLEHGALFLGRATAVRAAPVDAMVDEADVVVLAAGRGGSAGESRLDLLRDNAALGRELGARLRGFGGVVIVVSNPVDVMTAIVAGESGLPPGRVIGTGTLLDTARLRQELAVALDVHPQSVHAHVVGEHGDSSVCLWSGARVGAGELRAQSDWRPAQEAEIGRKVRRAAYEIIRRKGATNHAIGVVTAALVAAVLGDERRVLTVSRVGEPGEERAGDPDVAFSLPRIVGRDGAGAVVEPVMDAAERNALQVSVEVIAQALAGVGGARLAS